MTERLRMILPPVWTIAAFATFFCVLELPYWVANQFFGAALPADRHPSRAVFLLAGIAYGVYRVVAFHPFYRPDYREWLERTPWTGRKPLPVGPVVWVWEDVLILGALGALCWAAHSIDPLVIVSLALLSHGIVLTAALFPTGAWVHGYATAFALGFAVWLAPTSWAMLAAAAGANLVGHAGFRQSLRRFPWPMDGLERWLSFFQLKAGPSADQTRCGWPHDRLAPTRPESPHIDLVDAALVSLLSGWWIFALGSLIHPPDRTGVLSFVLYLGSAFCFVLRLGLYRTGFAPPISLWGRIVTLRWIIPGYDQIYIGPICILLAPWLVVSALHRVQTPLESAIPIACSVTLFAALACPPSHKRWRLTGRHRIVPSVQQKNEFVRVG